MTNNQYPPDSSPCELRFTDEDYGLVINVWRRQMGLKPII